jgi:hypothetical protein
MIHPFEAPTYTTFVANSLLVYLFHFLSFLTFNSSISWIHCSSDFPYFFLILFFILLFFICFPPSFLRTLPSLFLYLSLLYSQRLFTPRPHQPFISHPSTHCFPLNIRIISSTLQIHLRSMAHVTLPFTA